MALPAIDSSFCCFFFFSILFFFLCRSHAMHATKRVRSPCISIVLMLAYDLAVPGSSPGRGDYQANRKRCFIAHSLSLLPKNCPHMTFEKGVKWQVIHPLTKRVKITYTCQLNILYIYLLCYVALQ